MCSACSKLNVAKAIKSQKFINQILSENPLEVPWFSLMSKRRFLRPQNRSKMSKSVCVIAVSNEYIFKILGQFVGIRNLFDLYWKH